MILLVPILVFVAFLIICALMTVGQPLNPTRPLLSYDQAREYARRLRRLIACKTISREDCFDAGEFAKLRQVMEELFPLVHERCQKMTFGDDCWVYMLPGRDRTKNIMLMAHHDVVDADGSWQHAPFSGDIAEGKLWGRGTVDNKTSLFAIFSALEELLAEGFCPSCNVWIASSHNEEVAGDGIPLAARYFREQGIVFDFVLDEGGAVIDAPVSSMTCSKCAMVAIHEKGRHKLTLIAEAEHAHGGLAGSMGSTPTERMAEFIAQFRREDIFIRRMTPELEAMLKAMAPYTAFPVKVIFANLWLFKPMLIKYLPKLSPQAAGLLGTTCAFNDLVTEEGGKCCTARIMLRCIDGEDLQKDLAELRALAAKYRIRVEDGDSEYHGPSDPRHPAYQRLSQCIREIFPDVPVIPCILPAGTDARTLSELSQCVLRFAPLRLSAQQLASVHGENENVDIGAIGTAVVFYRRVLESYISGKLEDDMDEDDLEYEEDTPDIQPEESVIPEEIQETTQPEFDLTAYPDDILAEFSHDLLQEIPDSSQEVIPETLLDLGDYPVEENAEELPEDILDFDLAGLEDFDLNEFTDWEDLT